mmetsp:Transcript_25616/g.26716  ORF Transcript_25616/g.26716 Transcript_25616/m.26716 type:complete len:93 (+) Transcript_25616:827-1105(+)
MIIVKFMKKFTRKIEVIMFGIFPEEKSGIISHTKEMKITLPTAMNTKEIEQAINFHLIGANSISIFITRIIIIGVKTPEKNLPIKKSAKLSV